MKVVIASNNDGKIKEINKILNTDNSFEMLSQKDFNIPSVDETGETFIENAILKARHAAKISNLPCIAEDSGLCITALNNAPGLYSARYAGHNADSTDNIKKVLEELKHFNNHTDRSAFFYAIMVFLKSAYDPKPVISEGIWHGYITQSVSGENGFGYDPIFYVPELKCTSAQLSIEEKNMYSHRAQCLKQLQQKLIIE